MSTPEPIETSTRWCMLALGAFTNTLAVAAPSLCMPVLFKEISKNLDLSLGQLGVIWGIGALPGIAAVLLGGMLGDRIGPKRFLLVASVLSGLAGALRGLSNGYLSLAATSCLFSLLASGIPMNVAKNNGLWFSRRQLGLANGVVSMGMALGFLSGSMISATVLSPALGGWRNVLLFYGVISVLLSIPWFFAPSAPQAALPAGPESPIRMMRRVARIRNVWLLGWAILGIGGGIQAMLGYLPLYLRDIGWPGINADVAAASFHTASLICVIPIALWSDRLGSRKRILIGAALMVMIGIGLLSMVDGLLVWIAVIMAGLVRDGFMAVFLTMIVETEGVGPAYAGSATGLVMVFSSIGSVIAPPLGNSLAKIDPGLPFAFWASMVLAGFFGIYAAREEGLSRALAVPPGAQVEFSGQVEP